MTAPALPLRPRQLLPLLPLGLTVACLLWAFWTTLTDLAQTWSTNPQYSHGFLVPIFAAVLLYLRRERLVVAELRPNPWGFALLGAGIVLRLVGAFYFYVYLDPISLIPCVAGLTLLLGGRAAWRWAWPSVFFLAFMIPLPYSIANALAGPLQRLATLVSTFVMQVLGLPALADGTTIQLNEHPIGIVEACSGLRMMVVFFALSTAVVLVIRRHWIDKTIILLSAIPIALISNVFRVTVTGVLYQLEWSEMANTFFHDVAGWVMMPLALLMLWGELKLFSYLIIEAPVPAPRTRETRLAVPRTPRPAAPRTPAKPRTAVHGQASSRPAKTRRPSKTAPAERQERKETTETPQQR